MVALDYVKIALLTGGTGGVRFLLGLRNVVDEENINIIVNTGDDYMWNGLHVSPDIDTVIYALSGILDLSKMWGVKDDTFNFLRQGELLGLRDTWFRIGDKDLAMHVLRTYMLKIGYTLEDFCRYVCERLRIRSKVIPMTNDRVETHILTEIGDLHIQEFLVKYNASLRPLAVLYRGVENAQASRSAVRSLEDSEIIIIGPSSPPVSILPILYTKPIGEIVREVDKPKIAIMPMIGSRPISGITDKLLEAIGVEGSSIGIAKLYYEKYNITHVVCDSKDIELIEYCRKKNIRTLATDITIRTVQDAEKLAKTILEKI